MYIDNTRLLLCCEEAIVLYGSQETHREKCDNSRVLSFKKEIGNPISSSNKSRYVKPVFNELSFNLSCMVDRKVPLSTVL
jgi:hypothetical protein